ncbi:MAG: hypothetical protein RMJ84_10535 [Sandaracinaceae bacterium]|nr:hypothetical protein [Sandaracinaceae bacterium]
MKKQLIAWTACLFVACVSTSEKKEVYFGRVDGAPAMECLPDLDIDRKELSPRMRGAMEIAAASFQRPAPPPPEDRAADAISRWSQGPFHEWLQWKTQVVVSARRELDLAAEENHRQRILSGALVGMMYEDLARTLLKVPMPEDLDDEPEVRAAFENVRKEEARPFLEFSQAAYRACAANAKQLPGMRQFVDFCQGRLERLPSL